MKNSLFCTICVLVTLTFSLFGQAKELKKFHTLQVYDGIILSLVRSDSSMIKLSGENINFEQFDIREIEGLLRIRLKPGSGKPDKTQVKLYYNSLKRLEVQGKAEVWTENLVNQDSIDIFIRSGSQVYADMDVKYLSAKVSEGGLLKADGYALEQVVKVRSNATFSAFTLEGNTGNIIAGTGGIAKVFLNAQLQATAKSKGYIAYKGTPKLQSKTSLGGQIQKNEE